MKVYELIRALEKLNAPNAEVYFPIQAVTRRYPSAYVKSPESDLSRGHTYEHSVSKFTDDQVRIHIHLPEGFSIHERKK